MKCALAILALFSSSALALSSEQLLAQFSEFQSSYSKVYSSQEEEQRRFLIFSENVLEAERHNRGENSWTQGINMWSDMTQAEWEETFLTGYKRMVPGEAGAGSTARTTTEQLPESVDWRQRNAVTEVKDQGACGSCWAFAATEQIESYTAIASGELVELSTQQMTSCTPNPLTCGGTGGCMGSTPPLGYNYVQLFGQMAESDYPYISGSTSQSESCQYDLSSLSPVAAITGYNNLPPNNQEAVMAHIANVSQISNCRLSEI